MGQPSYFPRKRDLVNLMVHYEDDEMARQYPALYQLLMVAKRDGILRAGARLSLFADDQKLKASIWDPDTHSVWFATLESFCGALEAVEKLLQDGRGEWRVRKEQNGRR